MHRQPVQDLLRDYRRRYPEEAACVDRFERFVKAHEDCFERELGVGHVTGSAWLVNAAGTHVLLTHHRRLNRWLQLGGHADGDPDPVRVARREAEEESGLTDLALVRPELFDVDIHEIPAYGETPRHFHYDLRFAFRTTGSEAFAVTDESHELAWVPIDGLTRFTREVSMLRLAEKWLTGRDAKSGR